MKRLLLVLGVLFAAAPGRAQTAASPAPSAGGDRTETKALRELDAHLEKLAAEDQFSGVVLVAKGSVPIFRRAWGWADQAAGVRNEADTKFNLGSINKSFTSIAIAQLAQAGKLAFADTVGRHLPDYPNRAVADTVTIHHLLTHRSGMGDYFNERYRARRGELKALADYLPLFADEPLAFAPGEKQRYSNAGYLLLGLIIEKLSGQDYHGYVREHVFAPAGMRDTDSYERDRPDPKLAKGYMRMGPDGRPRPDGPREDNAATLAPRGSSAGGGYSTADDLLRFADALLGHRLLNPAFTETVFTASGVPSSAPEAGPMRGGYGFMTSPTPAGRAVGNAGGGPGVNAVLRMSAAPGYTWVVLSNYDPPAAEKVAGKLRELLTAK